MEFIFGIDGSKTTSNIAILVNGQPVKQFKINNNAKGFETLGKELNSFTEPSIIFEFIVVYSRSLENYLLQEDYQFTRINSLRAKKDMDSFRHNKTDSLDALGLSKAMSVHHYDPLNYLTQFIQNYMH
ncbi:IS110 family transposase [Companilactobacillus halodurans]|uniref:IS110 family transposase n=1 Tax=Companilactobacillus halodurans TaxID=2584183 RepID=UPI001EE25219|nr:IS110 family transposase [Companilactobacillus halodurans]